MRLFAADAPQRRAAADEYMAFFAEEGVKGRLSAWQKVRGLVKEALRRIGIRVRLTDADIAYLLYRSRRRLSGENATPLERFMDEGMRNRVRRSLSDLSASRTLGFSSPVSVSDIEAARLRIAPARNEWGVTPEAYGEMQEIKARAISDGTFMKAPNGADTRLTERQWLQVRTAPFKAWFGDWEKAARIGKLRRSKPVEITGEEYKGKYELNRDSAKQWIKDNLRGEYVIDDTNEKVLIGRKGINKVSSHSMGNEAHLKSLSSIPEMLKNAIFITEETADKTNAQYPVYRYYVVGLRIGDVDYTAKLTIGVDENGNKFYDHALTEIEKGTLIDNLNGMTNSVAENQNANGFISTGAEPYPSVTIGKDTKLLSLLQTNASKVVDENGEPKVVKHGTPNTFTAFDKARIGSSTDAGWLGSGFYFYGNADEYAGLYSHGGSVMELFLNVRDPYPASYSEMEELAEKNDREASDDFTAQVTDEGHDGVYYNEDLNEEWVVYEPSQIKSATDNNGEFSDEDNDIRFRVAYHGSPYDFDRFDHSHMGTGEGAQAYGWGTYVTEVNGIARAYASTPARAHVSFSGDKKKLGEGLTYPYVVDDVIEDIKGMMQRGSTLDEAASRARRYWNNPFEPTHPDMRRVLSRLKAEDFTTNRNLYTVDIPDDNGDNYLRWDGRADMVIDRAGVTTEEYEENDMTSGGDVYHYLAKKLGSDRAASEYLHDRGFVGISYPAQYTMGGRADNARNYVIFDEDDVRITDYVRFRITPEIREANAKFNEELEKLTEENADKVTLSLGRPSAILRSAGVADKPMKLYGNKVIKKMRKHGFVLTELRNLPAAVADPIAVFNNYGKNGNRSILTEVMDGDRNILVSVTVGKGNDVDFNLVSSVFGKGKENIVDWINSGYMTYVDKEKALDYLHFSRSSILEASNSRGLISDTKVGNNPDNTNSRGKEKALGHPRISAPLAEAQDNQGLTPGTKVGKNPDTQNNQDKKNASAVQAIRDFQNPKLPEDSIRFRYTKRDGINMSENASAALEEGKTDIGKDMAFGYFIEDSGLGTFGGEYHHVGQKFNRHYFVKFNDGVTLAQARREYNLHRDSMSRKEIEAVKAEYPDAIPEEEAMRRLGVEHVRDLWDSYSDVAYTPTSGIRWYIPKESGELRYRIANDPAAVYPEPQRREGETLLAFFRRYGEWREKKIAYEQITGENIPLLPRLRPGESLTEWFRAYHDYTLGVEDAQAVSEHMRNVQKSAGRLRQWQVRWTDCFINLKKFREEMQAAGAEILPEDDFYNAVFLTPFKITRATEKFRAKEWRDLLSALARFTSSEGIGNIELRWQNLDNEELKKEKERRNGTRLTPREIADVYVQAKDIEEAAQLGLPDRGADGFIKNLGVAHTDVIRMVEDNIPSGIIGSLWDNIRAATGFALDYEAEHGVISRETREKYRSRKYYVPERGWVERDMDGHRTNYTRHGGDYGSPYNPALVRAQGRTSIASSPFPYIQSIAESAIRESELNTEKLAFKRFAEKNEAIGVKTGAFEFSEAWLVNKRDDSGNVILAHDGKPLTEVTYARPTVEMFAHDREADEKIREMRKDTAAKQRQLEKTGERIAKAESPAADLYDLRDALARDIASLEQQITSLENSKYVAGYVRDEDIPRRTLNEKRQHAVHVREDGRDYVIRLESESVANAVNRRFDSDRSAFIDGMADTLARGTRLMASWNTQYNPGFAVANLLRDFQFAMLINDATRGGRYAARFARNTFAAMGAIHAYASGNEDSYTGKHSTYLKEFLDSGALTGYSFTKPVRDMAKDFDRELKRAEKAGRFADRDDGSHGYAIMRFMRDNASREAVARAAGYLSVMSEMAVRFGEYITARQSGCGVQEAASRAKEVSTNFDRHGLYGQRMNRLFAYFNATLQGSVRVAYAYLQSPRARARLAVFSLLYTAAGFLNTMLNPDDPDDEVYLSDYTRMTNLTLGNWRVPMPHYFRMFFALGVQAALAWQGRKPWEEAVTDTVQFIAGDLLPGALNLTEGFHFNSTTGRIGYDMKQQLRAMMPTVVSPLADVGLNMNFMGLPIAREPFLSTDGGRLSAVNMYNSRTAAPFRYLSDAILEITGGSPDLRYKAGGLDINPSYIEHIVSGYTPGLVKDIVSLAAMTLPGSGNSLDWAHIPVAGRFYSRRDPESAYRSQYWQLKNSVDFYRLQLRDSRRDPRRYREMLSSPRHKVYLRTQRILRRMDTPAAGVEASFTPADIRLLMDANAAWVLEDTSVLE